MQHQRKTRCQGTHSRKRNVLQDVTTVSHESIVGWLAEYADAANRPHPTYTRQILAHFRQITGGYVLNERIFAQSADTFGILRLERQHVTTAGLWNSCGIVYDRALARRISTTSCNS